MPTEAQNSDLGRDARGRGKEEEKTNGCFWGPKSRLKATISFVRLRFSFFVCRYFRFRRPFWLQLRHFRRAIARQTESEPFSGNLWPEQTALRYGFFGLPNSRIDSRMSSRVLFVPLGLVEIVECQYGGRRRSENKIASGSFICSAT